MKDESENLKLHEAIEYVLKNANRPLSPEEIAHKINSLGLYERGDGDPVPSSQIFARATNYSRLFSIKNGLISLSYWEGGVSK